MAKKRIQSFVVAKKRIQSFVAPKKWIQAFVATQKRSQALVASKNKAQAFVAVEKTMIDDIMDRHNELHKVLKLLIQVTRAYLKFREKFSLLGEACLEHIALTYDNAVTSEKDARRHDTLNQILINENVIRLQLCLISINVAVSSNILQQIALIVIISPL